MLAGIFVFKTLNKNFVRAVEPRKPTITPDVLRETTARQIRLIKEHKQATGGGLSEALILKTLRHQHRKLK